GGEGGGLRAERARRAGAAVRLGGPRSGGAGRAERTVPRFGSAAVRRCTVRSAASRALGALRGGRGGAAAAGPVGRADRPADAGLALRGVPATVRVDARVSVPAACASARRR